MQVLANILDPPHELKQLARYSSDFYYSTLLRVPYQYRTRFRPLTILQICFIRQRTTRDCELAIVSITLIEWSPFFSFWRNLSDDDVCVQRNAFCAVKALPQNAQIFIAKKSCPSFYRDGIGSVCHFSLSPWDEDDSRWIKAFGDAFIDGAVEHHHQRMNCKLTSSGDAILEEVAKIRNRMSEN